VTEPEAWKTLFPTFGRFLTFVFRTHFPYVLALALVALSFAVLAPNSVDARLLIAAIVLTAIYGWILFYKVFTLRNEIMADAEFRAAYLAMTDAERRRYFRKRGLDVDLSSLSFS
jgi:hypothetical protein